MTLQEARTLHAFNAWATNRLFDTVAAMPADDVGKDLKTSHGSIYGTLLHMVSAERTWLAIWQGQAGIPKLTPAEAPTPAALKTLWEKIGFETARFLGGMSDKRLQETFRMTISSGTTYTHTYAQAFHHVVDHSTYHRGQIVAMLRQLGVTPPATGLIAFLREIQKTS